MIVTLLDHARGDGKTERHCLFCVNIPQASSVHSWLGHFSEKAAVAKVEEYIETLSFGSTAIVVSSADYTGTGSKSIFYPKTLRAVMPSSHIRPGINFTAEVRFFDTLERYLEQLLENATLESNRAACVIYPDEDGTWFSLRRNLAVDRRIEAFDFAF